MVSRNAIVEEGIANLARTEKKLHRPRYVPDRAATEAGGERPIGAPTTQKAAGKAAIPGILITEGNQIIRRTA